MSNLSPYGLVIETLFRVIDKHGEVVDARLNHYQRLLDANWTRRNIIPKARRLGVSTYVGLRYVAKCLGEENRRCSIISHDAEATKMLLDKVRFTLDNLKGPRADIDRNNRNEIVFKKTNSTIYIGTAGSRNFGRGDTITDLHCSEIAFWSDPIKLVRGLFQAAKEGEITIESTGNGVGNWYHRQCKLAESGKGFTLHFFNWTQMPEHALSFAEPEALSSLSQVQSPKDRFLANLIEDYEETSLLGVLTPEQLNWRRDTITTDFDGDLRSFKQEYPLTLDECFQSTGYSFFQKVRYVPSLEWKRHSRFLWQLDGHPRPGFTYVIGADVSGGVGRDRSVAEVLCCDTNEQVAEYTNAGIAPDVFGLELASLGRVFNLATINPERNNHGLTTISELLKSYPSHLVHKPRVHGSPDRDAGAITAYGTNTDMINRGFMLGALKRDLSRERIIHSPELKGELDTFIEKESGKVEADDQCFDDRVMALSMANIIVEQAAIRSASLRPSNVTVLNPFSLDHMLDYFENKRTGLPIKEQALETEYNAYPDR